MRTDEKLTGNSIIDIQWDVFSEDARLCEIFREDPFGESIPPSLSEFLQPAPIKGLNSEDQASGSLLVGGLRLSFFDSSCYHRSLYSSLSKSILYIGTQSAGSQKVSYSPAGAWSPFEGPWKRRARKGRQDSLHREFAKLYLRTDDQILDFAREFGQLGVGFMCVAPAVRSDSPFCDILDPALAEVFEPLNVWRFLSSEVAYLVALLELGSVPRDREPGDAVNIQTRGTIKTVRDFVYEWTLSAIQANLCTDRIGRELLTSWNVDDDMFPQWPELAEDDSIDTFRRDLNAFDLARCRVKESADKFKSGFAQESVKRKFADRCNDRIRNMRAHLGPKIEWERGAGVPCVGIVARTLLGSVYASLLIESMKGSKPTAYCLECGGICKGVARITRQYCSDACRKRSQRRRSL